MKNTILFLVLFTGSTFMFGQNVEEVFTSSKTMIEFVGLDFSEAKMVGSEGFSDPAKIQSYYFPALNSLFLTEKDKYDVKRAFMKRDMDFDLGVVEEGNQALDFIDMVTNKTPKSFSDEKIQEMINKYNTEEMEAKFGLSFVVHSFNKFQETGYVYVVLFDAKSKKVLFSEKMSGEAGGFGFRNYWARSIYNIIEEIRTTQFRRWKRELTKNEG